MRLLRSFLVLAVAVSFLAAPSSAWAAKKKKKGAGAAGVVEQVQKASDKEDGSLVIKVQAKKKKNAAAPAEGTTRKFVLTKDTKFEKIVGKKKNKSTEAATSADLATGGRVIVTGAGDKAETVKILAAKKKKKKKNV